MDLKRVFIGGFVTLLLITHMVGELVLRTDFQIGEALILAFFLTFAFVGFTILVIVLGYALSRLWSWFWFTRAESVWHSYSLDEAAPPLWKVRYSWISYKLAQFKFHEIPAVYTRAGNLFNTHRTENRGQKTATAESDEPSAECPETHVVLERLVADVYNLPIEYTTELDDIERLVENRIDELEEELRQKQSDT